MLDMARERKWQEEDVDGMFGEEEAAQLEVILGNVEEHKRQIQNEVTIRKNGNRWTWAPKGRNPRRSEVGITVEDCVNKIWEKYGEDWRRGVGMVGRKD
jgi:hypothetical protein